MIFISDPQDLPANLNAKVSTNGAWLRIGWIGLPKHQSPCLHHIQPLPDLDRREKEHQVCPSGPLRTNTPKGTHPSDPPVT